jgi:ATP-dependent Clp protease ATP-binding subunit ClpA
MGEASPDLAMPLTDAARSALNDSADSAAQHRPWRVSTLHVLLGLIENDACIAGRVLHGHGVNDSAVWHAISSWTGDGSDERRKPFWVRRARWTDSARDIVQAASEEARARSAAAIDTGDLLIRLAAAAPSRAVRVLHAHGLELSRIRLAVWNERDRHTEIGAERAAV